MLSACNQNGIDEHLACHAVHYETNEEKNFSSPCSVPDEWIIINSSKKNVE
jgi:hypothetical protein